MPSSSVTYSLAQIKVAWYSNLEGGVDEITFCQCLASSKTSRGCLGFTHGTVRATIRHLNAAKCCSQGHRIFDPLKLLSQLPPEKGAVRSKKARVRRVGPYQPAERI